MKKFLALALALVLALTFVACSSAPSSSAPAAAASSSKPADSSKPAADTGEKPYIAVVSKGFQHQFWQVVKKGAEAAAAQYNVEITFDGPPTESDINIQVDMLKAAMGKNPAAVALAALDTESVQEQLASLKSAGVPVVGFDSGVPNAPEGSIYATASTDNKAAAAIAAENLMKNEAFTAALAGATSAAPITVGVLSQDATSESIISRTSGFVEKLVELIGADKVSVVGHDKYKKEVKDASVIIEVNVTATTAAADMKTGAETLLAKAPVAIYGSNENAAGGILAASNDGKDFNKEDGKYKDIVAIGFDAGKTQRNAVQEGWFYGSVTQDPYQIGFKAVELCVQALEGKAAASDIVDTGAKWYNAENLSDPMISDLVYE